jgi:UPF0716 protein FxsA
MGWIVLLVLLALPVAELTVLVVVAGDIGVFNTIGLLILVSLVGGWLAKQAGLGVVSRLRQAQAEGRPPSREVIDAGLVLLAGVLLVLPGFNSDIVGILLLFPPTRAVARTLVLRHLARRGQLVVVGRSGSGQVVDEDVWDVESWEDTPRAGGGGEIGPGS